MKYTVENNEDIALETNNFRVAEAEKTKLNSHRSSSGQGDMFRVTRKSDGATVVRCARSGRIETLENALLPPPIAHHSPVPSPVGAWARVTIGDTMTLDELIQAFKEDGWNIDVEIRSDGRVKVTHAGLHMDENQRVVVLRSLASQAKELKRCDADLHDAILRRHVEIMEKACQGTVRRWRHTCDKAFAGGRYNVTQWGDRLYVVAGMEQSKTELSWLELMDALTGA